MDRELSAAQITVEPRSSSENVKSRIYATVMPTK